MMANPTLNNMINYEGAFTTTNPTKIEFILNKILHNPNSALIIEPVINEYWVFYYGGATIPADKDKEINHFQKVLQNKKNIEIDLDEDKWVFVIIKFDDPIQFFDDAMGVLNKIKNKSSIKVAIEQPEVKRKLYINYKR
jgi:hypothetical protein